jgi:hypothetical protein
MGSPRVWPLFALFAFAFHEGAALSTLSLEGVTASDPSLLETDPRAMEALESEGLSLSQVFGARGPGNDALAQTDAWSTLLMTLDADLGQLAERPVIADVDPREKFQPSWLRDPRARFELIGAVNRLDRSFLDPSACGEARLVYRLVLRPAGRPPTSLPMTVSVIFPQPKRSSWFFGTPSCAPAAQAWLDLPPDGARRVHALAELYARLGDYTKVEINLQTLDFHSEGPLFSDGGGFDGHAEYLLRSFDRIGDALVPRRLVDTPRFDLDGDDKRALAAWVRANFDAIDAGGWVIPDRFLATRALSVTPRGFARGANRVFSSLFGDGSDLFANLPYDGARLVKSPAGLLRRLDQGTCEGCHETRAVAGFHLLGESRTPQAQIDAVAVARSPHVEIELEWRAAMTASVARGTSYDVPRPFADRKHAGPGRSGAHCGVHGDPTFAGWSCASGLVCHELDRDDVGACVRATPRGLGVGEPCEDVTLGEDTPAFGSFVEPGQIAPCAFGNQAGNCAQNLFGFPEGMCEAACPRVGAVADGGELICGRIPSSGYEMDCLWTTDEPIEKCIERYLGNSVLRTCAEGRPCRDDYACGRMIDLPPKTGVCVPTYFVYGLRVDGPLLDR